MSSFTNPNALISTAELAARLDDPTLRIIEVDEDTEAWRRGHIQGAIAWNWRSDLHHPVRRDYLDREALSALLARSGVDTDTTVVLYGGNHNWFAAYAYWLLAYRGFVRVRLLDGGRTKWTADERPFTQEAGAPTPTTYRLDGPERPDLRALRDHVLGAADATFVDVRSPEEYSGEKLAPDHLPQEQPYVGGHVPGAVNIPWSRAACEDGTFRSAEELYDLYYGAGVVRDAPVITYCRIGERSSHTWFVLHELLGHPAARNYDGSWTEYGSLVGVPVETGAGGFEPPASRVTAGRGAGAS